MEELIIYWIALGLVIFPINLIFKAPYGRHSSKRWGIMIDNKLGWIIMELPALVVCPIVYFLFESTYDLSLLFISIWVIHYFNRTIIYPFRIKTKGKKMPLTIACSAFFFNIINGFFNGYFIALINIESLNYLLIYFGLFLFLIGFYINVYSDNKLIKLRRNKEGYQIPKGGFFKYISCPNFFGEIIEWIGFSIMTFNLASLSFLIWTCCNLVPRSLAHHKWYLDKFEKYPKKRKAIFPFLL